MKTLMAVLFFVLALGFVTPAHAQAVLNCKIKTQTDVAVTGTSTLALAANSHRRCLVFQAHGSSTVYIKFGAVHTGTEGISISNAFWEPAIVPTGSVYLKSSANISTTVIEGE